MAFILLTNSNGDEVHVRADRVVTITRLQARDGNAARATVALDGRDHPLTVREDAAIVLQAIGDAEVVDRGKRLDEWALREAINLRTVVQDPAATDHDQG
ncbi:hypothetical protein CPT_Suso_003 [Stenotrophomonas phage Suso]|nr:hypothetical protein CPT_Suso_003 [Stenotrophomonas phage Suso]